MTIIDKSSKIIENRTRTKNVIKGVYDFDFDDDRGQPILKMFHVELEKNKVVDDHSHDLDILTIITDGSVEVTEKNKKSKIYNKGDWYITKKGTTYNVKALDIAKMDCSHGAFGNYMVTVPPPPTE